VTLLWVFTVCFLLLHAMPGDPLDRLESPSIPAEQADRTRRALGLDRPLPEQLARTLGAYARGDLGVSTTRQEPVLSALAGTLPSTAALGAATLVLAYGLGIPVALLLSGLGRGARRWLDRSLVVVATLPRFWFAVMLVLVFHGLAGWLPASHALSPGGGGLVDRLRHLVLPALALGLPAACVVARYQWAVMERVLDHAHVRAARATGAGGPRLIARHVLRPSLGAAVTLCGRDLPVLVSGAIVVEVVFAWPGLGRLSAEAVLGSDYPLALAAALLAATVVIAGRLLTQWIARAVSPLQAEAEEARS
jgi:peptide/nickel transport system permease protein